MLAQKFAGALWIIVKISRRHEFFEFVEAFLFFFDEWSEIHEKGYDARKAVKPFEDRGGCGVGGRVLKVQRISHVTKDVSCA